MKTEIKLVSHLDKGLADAVRAVHLASLPDDISPNLTRSYHFKIFAAMANPVNGRLAVAVRHGVPIGFCGVVNNSADFNRTIARERLDLCASLIRISVRRPILLVEFAGVLFGPALLDEPIDGLPEIFAICVAPGNRAHGVGRMLLDAVQEPPWQESLVARTADRSAEAFYIANGFRLVGHQNRFRRQLAVLKRDPLSPP